MSLLLAATMAACAVPPELDREDADVPLPSRKPAPERGDLVDAGSEQSSDAGGDARCVDACVEGRTECNSTTTFRRCVAGADACTRWSTEPCKITTATCAKASKACFGQCVNHCSTDGQITCTGSSSYVVCERDEDQCLVTRTGVCVSGVVCFTNPTACRGP